MVLGWRQWWSSILWHLNWLQRLLPLFSLPVLYLHKQFSDFQLLILQISNRRSGRGSYLVSDLMLRPQIINLLADLPRSLSTTSQKVHLQKNITSSNKKAQLTKKMAIKHKEVTTNFNQSLTVNNTYIQNISNEIFLWYPKTCWQ